MPSEESVGARRIDPVITNVEIYRQIAEAAFAQATASLEMFRRPKDDGSPGHVISFDPERSSFKQSMIAIVFAGMTMEAWLWVRGVELVGAERYAKIDRLPIDERLVEIGIANTALADDLRLFRAARKELVHEKALPLSQDTSPVRTAQTEARTAIEVMRRLLLVLQVATF